jgi:dTDP-glucose pyrophosphorylase
MAPLGGQPVLAHVITNLARAGVTDAHVALQYMPDKIRDWFGDAFGGVELHYHVDGVPRGTAGAVRDCMKFLGSEPFLVVSGDCVCDFNLGELSSFHREHEAELTVALYKTSDPTEYGAVVTDETGRITLVREKPAWERVVTDSINTGMYMVSPELLHIIPESGDFDFARDLFPLLLSEKRRFFAVELPGYWRDIGSPESYRQCAEDWENGKIRLKKRHILAGILGRDHDRQTPCFDLSLQSEPSPEFTLPGVITLKNPVSYPALLRLASSCARFRVVGVGANGSRRVCAAASLFCAGISAYGGDCVRTDAENRAISSFSARLYSFPLTVFISESQDAVVLYFRDKFGAPISREAERKILGAPAQNQIPGTLTEITGTTPAYNAWLIKQLRDIDSSAASAELLPLFSVSSDGTSVSAATESGAHLDHDRLLLLCTMLDLKLGRREFPLPPDMPECTLRLITTYGRKISAGHARGFLPWAHDARLLSLRISAYLKKRGTTLDKLHEEAPDFARTEMKIPVSHGRAEVMRALTSALGTEAAGELGLTLRPGGGVVRVCPSRAASELSVVSEASDPAAAKALAARVEAQIKQLDSADARQ